jgi:hypothetical protein
VPNVAKRVAPGRVLVWAAHRVSSTILISSGVRP